ncbi:MAG: hypothetical protein ACQCN6_04660 [Candidatus Bathyarchaeia archaeon]
MVKCQHCGKQLEPERTLENRVFRLEAYNCDRCGEEFKIAYYPLALATPQ